MRVGDLVKYKFRIRYPSAEGVGLVIDICNMGDVFENRIATILWSGIRRVSSHRFALLEVVHEGR